MNRIASLQLRPLQLGNVVQQYKSNQRQNRLLGLQESQFENQVKQQDLQRQDDQAGKDAERAAKIEQLEGRLYGGAVELIGQTDDPAEKQAIWQQALEVAGKFDIDTTGAPAQLTPETENFIRLKAQAQGYKPAKEEAGFTLGQGQQRFDSGGNLIASGPEKSSGTGLAVDDFIGTPVRVERDGKTFLAGMVQTPEGKFEVREVGVDGELTDTSGRTAAEQIEAKGREAAVKQATTQSSKAFDRLEGINTNISNLKEVVRLVDKGAGSRSEERRVGKECRSRWSPED